MVGQKCAKGLTLRIHEKLPVSPFFFLWERNKTGRRTFHYVSSIGLFACTNFINAVSQELVVCIYVSRTCRKEVESSPSKNKRSGKNETQSSQPHIGILPNILLCMLTLFLSAQAR